jgi:hypothetical protein
MGASGRWLQGLGGTRSSGLDPDAERVAVQEASRKSEETKQTRKEAPHALNTCCALRWIFAGENIRPMSLRDDSMRVDSDLGARHLKQAY